MTKQTIKTPKEIEIMKEGGRILAIVRDELEAMVAPGVSAWDIEQMAVKRITELGAKPSFMMVPGYSWATCINVNDGVVHGIPKKSTVLKKGDIMSIDVGVFLKGFHTDTAVSVYLGDGDEGNHMITSGREVIAAAIKEAKVGNTIGDISKAIEDGLTTRGLVAIKALTGHGVGRELHEDPRIPCFVGKTKDERVKIENGMTLAIEIMYTPGRGEIMVDSDGWTIRTKDGRISALFEETVAILNGMPVIITKAS